ncbi:hypothetical protein FRX31_004697 [Thalictrum thalictroides]|uniref:Uncharacterized protein n=1 Tax=Thalictrum thalictroides TaxID=46969 RepID=A0A7J6X7F7_THATH|nr:hypothetical protein FRX31_004697 [Thalictrum thalictroides]
MPHKSTVCFITLMAVPFSTLNSISMGICLICMMSIKGPLYAPLVRRFSSQHTKPGNTTKITISLSLHNRCCKPKVLNVIECFSRFCVLGNYKSVFTVKIGIEKFKALGTVRVDSPEDADKGIVLVKSAQQGYFSQLSRIWSGHGIFDLGGFKLHTAQKRLELYYNLPV